MSGRNEKRNTETGEMTAAEYIRELAVSAYMLALFVVLPLILKDKYRMLGTFKYEVFRLISLIGLGMVILTEVSVLLTSWYKNRGKSRPNTSSGRQRVSELWKGLSLTDRFVLGYGICVIISFCLSVDKMQAIWGTKGWYMGLVSQLIFVLSYFVVSRWWSGSRTVWYLACGTAFIVYLLGVLHRFSVDPLGLYEGLSEGTIKQYLSLIGQNTWYSSYMCTLFPLGLFLFWGIGAGKHLDTGDKKRRTGNRKKAAFYSSEELLIRLTGGIFCAVGFASWVTQNSDSAYIALSLIVLVLFYYGFTGNEWMERFLEVLLLLFFSAAVTGFLQDLFPEQAVLPETISIFLTKSLFPVLGFLAVCVVYVLFFYGERRGLRIEWYVWIGRAAVLLYVLAVLMLAGVVVLNTKGYLADWFGFSTQNNYLLFDQNWGNGRGRTWSFSAQVLWEFPWYRKLFGAGPDSFAAYGYGNPVYAQQLADMWGDSTLTNAHCEWMNELVCYGIVGAACFAGIFVSAVGRFYKAGRSNPALIAVALCLLSYTGHNVFCYQQAVCTPFVFLILGMGERLLTLEETGCS